MLDIVREAYRQSGITPIEEPIRGGTDGARLSVRGLPCPNVFTGGMNFHGVYECIPVRADIFEKHSQSGIGAFSPLART